MDKYLTPAQTGAKLPRAPRNDLSTLTAEEKVERRKARAREYSRVARLRSEELAVELTRDVEAMRAFEAMVEESPALRLVLAPDLNALVMYANRTAVRLLSSISNSTSGINSKISSTSGSIGSSSMLGRSFYSLIHPDDALVISPFLQRLILSRDSSRGPPLRCRLWSGGREEGREGGREGEVVETEMWVAFGRQGLVCSLWIKDEEKVAKKEGRMKGGVEVKERQVLSGKEGEGDKGVREEEREEGCKRTKRR